MKKLLNEENIWDKDTAYNKVESVSYVDVQDRDQ